MRARHSVCHACVQKAMVKLIGTPWRAEKTNASGLFVHVHEPQMYAANTC
jgi:hypothetical protein